MRAVSDEMVLTLSAAATADDVAARISALLKAGPQAGGAVSSRGGWGRQWRHPPDDRGPIITEALDNPVWYAPTGSRKKDYSKAAAHSERDPGK